MVLHEKQVSDTQREVIGLCLLIFSEAGADDVDYI